MNSRQRREFVRRSRAVRLDLFIEAAVRESEQPAAETEDVIETPELIDARLKRDSWTAHARGSASTAYAREQSAYWTRRVAELEQELRPIGPVNVINAKGAFANADDVVTNLRSIREQVATGPSQMEML